MIGIFKWVTKDTNINFMKSTKVTYALSSTLILLAIICIVFKGFNFGIDFSGGILMEIKSPQVIDVDEMRDTLNKLDIDDLNLQSMGEDGTEIVIRAQAKELDEKAQMNIINANITNILCCASGALYPPMFDAYRERVEAYLADVKQAGIEYIRNDAISLPVINRLKEPLVPPAEFMERFNALWNWDYVDER